MPIRSRRPVPCAAFRAPAGHILAPGGSPVVVVGRRASRAIAAALLGLVALGIYEAWPRATALPASGSAGPRVIRFVRTSEKAVAFTFDDGPGPETTAIIRAFQAQHGRATFFVVGLQAEKYMNLLVRESGAGDEIGNHTWNHTWIPRLTRVELAEQLGRTDAIIRSATGQTVTLFRFPGFIMTERSLDLVQRMGYRVVGASVDPRDWTRAKAGTIAARVMESIHPGAIVVMHDGPGGRQETVKALGLVLPELARGGYRFVTVSELLRLEDPK